MKKDDEIIKSKLSSLDEVELPLTWGKEEVWQNIQLQKKRKANRQVYLWMGSTAASITLLFLFNFHFFSEESLSVDIQITQEVFNVEEQPLNVRLPEELSALAFIEESCKEAELACSSAEFNYLKAELKALDKEMDQIEGAIAKYGDEPTFVKSKIQIENLRSEITFKLVQMILS